jgi:hypothetical protein
VVAIFKKQTLAELSLETVLLGPISIDSRILAEVADFPEADQIESFDRGNLQKQISFRSERQHANEDAAELFANTHDEEILGKGDLILKGGGGDWQRLYSGATCVRCSCYAEGTATFTSYEFVTGRSKIKKR